MDEMTVINAQPTISVEDFTGNGAMQMYCSLKDDGTQKSKAAIYNAVNSPDKKVSDFIGKKIAIKNVCAHPIELTDEETGELITAMRIILLDADGVAYEAVSNGIANAVQRLFQIFGQPETWEEPITVEVQQKNTRNGNNKVTTFKVV